VELNEDFGQPEFTSTLFSFLDVAIDRKLKVQRLLGTLNSLFFAASSSLRHLHSLSASFSELVAEFTEVNIFFSSEFLFVLVLR